MPDTVSEKPSRTGLVEERLGAYAARYRRQRLVHGTGLTLAALLLPLPLVCLADRFTLLAEGTRYTLWAAYVLVAAVLIGWFVVRRVLQKVSVLDAAFAVGDQLPQLHQSLAAAVQFQSGPAAQEGVSRGLVDEARAQAQADAAAVDLQALLPSRRAVRVASCAALLAAVQIGLLCVPGLGYADLLLRFIYPFGNFDRVSGVEVVVTPGSLDAGDGETVIVDALVDDPELARLGLYRGAEGAEPQRFEMVRLQPGHFRFTLPNLRRDLSYYLAEDLIRTRTYRVRVRRRPRLEEFVVRYEFPSYTGLPPREDRQAGGEIAALRGTRVTLGVSVDTACRRIALRKLGEAGSYEDQYMELDGRTAKIAFELTESFRYEVVAFSTDLDLENEDRIAYAASAAPDRAPVVAIAEPGARIRLDAARQQRIHFSVKDEFAVRAVRLSTWREGEEPQARSVEAKGWGTAALNGSGLISLPELKAEPGEEIRYAIEAQDALGQWGRSATQLVEVPVASGDAEALALAQSIEPARKGLQSAQAQLETAHAAFKRMHGLLAARPLKWNEQLEKAAGELRPAIEALRQKSAHAAGLLAQQSDAADESEAAGDLRELSGLAKDLDVAVKRLDLETALRDIREDFKDAGTQRAQDVVALLEGWRPLAASSVKFLTLYERLLRVRDLERRTAQLARAQQSVLVEAHTRNDADARLRTRQRLIFEELVRFAADAESAAKIGAGDRSLPGAPSWKKLTADVNEMREAVQGASAFPIEKVVKFEPQVQAASKGMDEWLASHESAVLGARDALEAVRASMIRTAAQLRALAKGLLGLAQDLAEDPLDKEDELVFLPPHLASLRRLLDQYDRISGLLWQNTDAQERARARASQAHLAARLGDLRRGALSAAAQQTEKIVATFPQETAEATPLLPALRKSLAQTEQDLGVIIRQAEVLECEHDISTLEDRAESLARRQRHAPNPLRLRLGLGALAKNVTAAASALKNMGEGTAAKRLAECAGNLGGRLDLSLPLPPPLLQGWSALQDAGAHGTAAAAKVRQDLARQPEARAESLRALAAAYAAAAARARKASPTSDPPGTMSPEQATELRALALELRRADGRMLEELAGLGAEPFLHPDAQDAVDIRAAFLMLWQARRAESEPAVLAAEGAAVVPDAATRGKLLDLAAQGAERTATWLEQNAVAIADPLGSGRNACQAFLKREGLTNEFEASTAELASLGKEREAALALGAELAAAKDAKKTAGLQARLSELSSQVLNRDAVRKAQPSEYLAVVQQIANELGALSQAEAELARRLMGIGYAEQAVKQKYEEIAKSAAQENRALSDVLAAALPAAQALGSEIEKAFATGLAEAKAAQALADTFGRDPSVKLGASYSKALEKCGDLDRTEQVLAGSLAKQKRRETEREAIEALWPRWQAAAAKLAGLKLRYDQEAAARDAAYDHCLAVAQKGYDPILEHILAGELVPYYGNDLEMIWFWTQHGSRFHGSWYNELLKTGTYNYRNRYPASATAEEIMIDFKKSYWGKRFFGNPYKESYPAFVNLLEGKRHFTFHVRDNYVSFAQHWKGLVKGLPTTSQYKPFGLEDAIAHAERAIAKAQKTKPEDVAKLKKYQDDLRNAAKEIEAAADAALPTNTVEVYTQSRRRWAKESAECVAELKSLAEEIGELAKAAGWTPASLDPRSRPSGRGTPSAPGLPSTISAAATLSAMLLNEVRGVRQYDLLAGEEDPNADLKKAKLVLSTAPPDRAYDYAVNLAAAAGQVMEDIINYLGVSEAPATTSTQKRGGPDFPEQLDASLHRRFLEIGDAKTLSRQFERWDKILKVWSAIAQRYAQEAKAGSPEENEKLRRAFGAELEHLEAGLRPVVNALIGRATVAGLKLPDLDATDVAKRRMPAPKPRADVKTAALCLFALHTELRGIWMYDLLGGAMDPNFDAKIAKAKLAEAPEPKALSHAAALVEAAGKTLAALKADLSQRGGQGDALKQLDEDCKKLIAAGRKLAELREREPSIRAAVEASGEGGEALKTDFYATQDRAQRTLAHAAAGAALLRACNAPAQALKALENAGAPAFRKQFGQALAALQAGKADQAGKSAEVLGTELESLAAGLREGCAALQAGEAGSGAPQAISRRAAARELLFAANLDLEPEALQAEQVCALLLAGRALDRAALQAVDGLGLSWAQQAGEARRKELAGLLQSSEPDAATAASEVPREVLGRLRVRPEGRNPFAGDYGKLSPAMMRLLEGVSLERRPPEAEAALARYLHALRHPPKVQVRERPGTPVEEENE